MADSIYIKYVRDRLDSKSGIMFQNNICIILNEYYKTKGLEFENPNSYGGDDKNDGWVPKLALFYQIFSPINYSKSFAREVYDKFEEDIKGLCKNVITNKLWGGKINKFIYIVNTRDQSLPKDSSRRCEKIVKELELKYSINIEYEIKNTDYIEDLLFEISDENILKLILTRLGFDSAFKYTNISEHSIIEFIDIVSKKINESMLYNIKGTNYKRISTDRKILINDLSNKAEIINEIILKLNIVENAISEYNRKTPMSSDYNVVKEYIILKYKELMNDFHGADLYDKILDNLLYLTGKLNSFKIPAEFFLVYVFDKCDIFEKEEKYDTAQ